MGSTNFTLTRKPLYSKSLFDFHADITLEHLTVLPLTLSTVLLEWKVIPTDGHHCITSYNIQVSGPNGSQWETQIPGGNNSFLLSGMQLRSTHTLLLATFHLFKVVQLSTKHHLWKFKACLTKHKIRTAHDVCSLVLNPL